VATASRLPDLSTRIRVRRSQLGLTGADLAARASISTSYVSLIENGAKVPDQDVAAQLADALEDDPDLYRAWARAARLGVEDLELLSRLEAVSRAPAYHSLVESGHELPRLAEAEAPDDLGARIREVATRLTSPSSEEQPAEWPAVLAVPLLAPGVDPDAPEGAARPSDRLLLDRRLLSRAAGPLFACPVTEAALPRLRGVAQAGDVIVFERGRQAAPDRVCAVRRPAGLTLSRVLVSERSLLLLPGEGETAFESIELAEGRSAAELVIASHVLLVRR
jgi:transcriptional regulator with XRE-family HTH domain